MDVDTAEFREVKDVRRQDFAIGGNEDEVGVVGSQDFCKGRIFQTFGLKDVEGIFLCEEFDRTGRWFHATPCETVWSGNHSHNLVIRIDEALKRWYCKIRRAGKNNSHKNKPFLVCSCCALC